MAAVITPLRFALARELVQAGAVRDALLLGQNGGYALVLRVGQQERVLAGGKGQPRLFASADTAVNVLRELGMTRCTVDGTHLMRGDLLRGAGAQAARDG